MGPQTLLNEIRSALGEIVEGRSVKRSRHDLQWGTGDLSDEFISILTANGYAPTTVRDLPVDPGRRVPAFYIDGTVAHFGWVFWEIFSGTRRRKLFGSVIRNAKGDWDVQIPPSRTVTIYANISLGTDMDLERPFSL